MGLSLEGRAFGDGDYSICLPRVVSRQPVRRCHQGVAKKEEEEEGEASSPSVSNAAYRKLLHRQARTLRYKIKQGRGDNGDYDSDHHGVGCPYVDKPCRVQLDAIAHVTGVDLHCDGTIAPWTVVYMYDQMRSALRNAVLYRIGAMQLFQGAAHDVTQVSDSWLQRKHWGIVRYREYFYDTEQQIDIVDAFDEYAPTICADTDVDRWMDAVEDPSYSSNSFCHTLAFLKAAVEAGVGIFCSC